MLKKIEKIGLVVSHMCLCISLSYANNTLAVQFDNYSLTNIQSFKALRDKGIVKQNYDFSCGAASLATLLNNFYGLNITELQVMQLMDKEKYRASFEDLQIAAQQLGFKAVGYATNFEQLVKLKIPVIVYLKYRDNEHFSVLRGINESTVVLADPSLGNRSFSKEQFIEMWEKTNPDASGEKLSGKIFAVLPTTAGSIQPDQFFTKNPVRQTAPALEQMMLFRIQSTY